jgi:hypothetical protein
MSSEELDIGNTIDIDFGVVPGNNHIGEVC